MERFAVIFLAIIYPAFAEIQNGTLGVVYFSEDKIVMTIDSRVNQPGSPPADDGCKVAALKGQVIVMTSGAAAYIRPDGASAWNNLEVAQEASEQIRRQFGTVRDYTFEIAKVVAGHLQGNWLDMYKRDSAMVGDVAGDDGIITVILFGGIARNGSLELVQATVLFRGLNPPDGFSPVGFNVGRFGGECQPRNMCAIGRTEIFNEFNRVTTQRAEEEQRSWGPSADAKTPPRFYDLRRAMRMVELTIQHDSRGTVGGAIDAVQLNRDGTIEWYARKDHCPEY